MNQLLQTKVGRLRLIAFLEGISLLVLVLVAVPMKYVYGNPALTKFLGPVHGAIFLLFLFITLSVGVEKKLEIQDHNLESAGSMFHSLRNILYRC